MMPQESEQLPMNQSLFKLEEDYKPSPVMSFESMGNGAYAGFKVMKEGWNTREFEPYASEWVSSYAGKNRVIDSYRMTILDLSK